MMKNLRQRIKEIILQTDGFPGFEADEYVREVKLVLSRELSGSELDLLRRESDIDSLIMEITKDATADLF